MQAAVKDVFIQIAVALGRAIQKFQHTFCAVDALIVFIVLKSADGHIEQIDDLGEFGGGFCHIAAQIFDSLRQFVDLLELGLAQSDILRGIAVLHFTHQTDDGPGDAPRQENGGQNADQKRRQRGKGDGPDDRMGLLQQMSLFRHADDCPLLVGEGAVVVIELDIFHCGVNRIVQPVSVF